MINYEIWTAKTYTTEEYNLLIDFFDENYYHILETLVQMAEGISTKQELQKQVMLLDIFQDVQNQLECYRDSEIATKNTINYGEVIDLMNKENISYQDACERIAKKNEANNNNN